MRAQIETGSSPRTRGTGRSAAPEAGQRRFIPAHAGNRRAWRRPHPRRAVHPRARGEQELRRQRAQRRLGSSPRTRGTGLVHYYAESRRRFIPAHAGNRAAFGAKRWLKSVHPRARGEQNRLSRFKSSATGSSPRTRGTVRKRFPSVSIGRFIPAHAGNSWRDGRGQVQGAVHPRARGEQSISR